MTACTVAIVGVVPLVLLVPTLFWIANKIDIEWSAWEQFMTPNWDRIPQWLLTWPNCYLALAILLLVPMRLWPYKRQGRCRLANVDPRELTLIWPTVALTIMVIPPTLCWFAYSVHLILLHK